MRKDNWEITIQSFSLSAPPKAKHTFNIMLLISMSSCESDKCWVIISNCLILLPSLGLFVSIARTYSLFGVLCYYSKFLGRELLHFPSLKYKV